MTTTQATEVTAFIVNPALRARAAARLVSGGAFLCPDCGQIADTAAGCYPCDDARFTAQEAEYDALMNSAETSTGCDAFARF